MTRIIQKSGSFISLAASVLTFSSCTADFNIGYKDGTTPLTRVLGSIKPATVPPTGTPSSTGSTTAALVDQTDDDNSATGFGGGTMQGLVWDGSKISLDSSNTVPDEFDASWTPQYGNLLAYWRLDGSTGIVANNVAVAAAIGTNASSSNANGTGLAYTTGHIHEGLTFDGVDDHLEVPAASAPNPNAEISVSFWMKASLASQPGTWDRIIDKFDTVAPLGWQIIRVGASGTVGIQLSTSGGANQGVGGAKNVYDNQFHHIVATASAGVANIYVDGNIDGSAVYIHGAGFSSTADLWVGDNWWWTGFNGTLDEIAIWDKALTAREIKTIFEKQSGKHKNYSELDSSWAPQWSTLIHYWKLEGDWNDAIGALNGVAAGSPFFSDAAKVGSQAAVFTDTSSEMVTLGTIAGPLTNGTYSIWINPNNLTSDNQGFIDTDDSFDVFQWGGNLYFRPGNNGNQLSTSISWTPGTWHHLAMTWNGTTFAGYLNGTQIVSGPMADSLSGTIVLGRNDGVVYYNGKLDEFALWSTALSASEVKAIYDRQSAKYSSVFSSRTMDATVTSSWTDLSWKTTLPFFKELPDGGLANTERSSNYSALVGSTGTASDNDLMTGIVGLWHMNESSWNGTANEVIDSSGNGHSGSRAGTTTTTTDGAKFSRSGTFNGATDYVTLGNAGIGTMNEITLSAWVATTKTVGFQAIIGEFLDGTCGDGLFRLDSGHVNWNDGTSAGVTSTITVADGQWHHVAAVSSLTDTTIYVDGLLDTTGADTNWRSACAVDVRIGATAGNSNYFQGLIDEVAVWSRALDPTEIAQLYRRGANRLKFQSRSCATNPCTVESWLGPDGTNLTYFSELNNSTVPAGGGLVLPTLPDVFFSAFSGLTVPSNRYFQYRAIFESDDPSVAVSPDLQSLRVGPTR